MQRVEWDGMFFDGVLLSAKPVKVLVLPEGLEVWTGTGEIAGIWPYAQLRQTQGFYTGQVIRLETSGSPPNVLTVSDNEFLDAVHQVAGPRSRHFHRRLQLRWRVLFVVLAALSIIGIGGWLYTQGVPRLANLASQRVPVSWEERIGTIVVDQVETKNHTCVETKRARFIDQLVSTLTRALPSNPYVFRVSVVDSPVVNAFAAPGGYIVVYKGLLQFTQSPEELAGVLAHEIQHVTYRHVTRQVLRQASLGVIFGAMTGDLNGAMAVGIQTASLLGGLSYSRAAEEEADREARKLLIAAGIDPNGMVTVFERLRNKSFPTSSAWKYLSTHPPLGDRIRALEGRPSAVGAPSIQLMPPVEWKDMAEICFVHPNSSL